MKSLFYRGALLLSLCVSSAVSAQESVVITMGYLPDREYLIFDESEKVARSGLLVIVKLPFSSRSLVLIDVLLTVFSTIFTEEPAFELESELPSKP